MCFSCTDQKSNFYCLKPTICSNSDNYCVTISAAAGIGECWPGLPRSGPWPQPARCLSTPPLTTCFLVQGTWWTLATA